MCAEFNTKYATKPTILEYIRTTWIPYKGRFISAWANQCLHFGNVNTSRVEGAHYATIKSYLKVYTWDLRDAFQRLKLALKN